MGTDTHRMGRSLNDNDMERIIIMKKINHEQFEEPELFDEIFPRDTNVEPYYYNLNGMEAFDVMEAFVGDLKGIDSFYWCNVVKYILRWQNKGGVQDLKKAKEYLQKLIDKYDN